MSERMRAFAEVTDLWRRVHEAQGRRDVTALDRLYLEGMEEVLDWLMGSTCPNGDTRARSIPALTNGFGWTLMLLPEHAAQDAHDENGGVFFTRPATQRKKKPTPEVTEGERA